MPLTMLRSTRFLWSAAVPAMPGTVAALGTVSAAVAFVVVVIGGVVVICGVVAAGLLNVAVTLAPSK